MYFDVFTNKCPKNTCKKELYATTGGGALHTIYCKCFDGTILLKSGTNRGNLKKNIIGKANKLNVYSSNSEYQWTRRISGIANIKSSDVEQPTKLKYNKLYIIDLILTIINTQDKKT